MRKRLLANIDWLFAYRITCIVGGLVIGIWVARYLGPGDYGRLNFALSFAALFGMVGRLSIDPVAVRDLTKFPERAQVILGLSLEQISDQGVDPVAAEMLWKTVIQISK